MIYENDLAHFKSRYGEEEMFKIIVSNIENMINVENRVVNLNETMNLKEDNSARNKKKI